MTKVEKMRRCDRPMVMDDLEGLITSLKSAPEKQAKDAACLLVDMIVYGTAKDLETMRQAIRAVSQWNWRQYGCGGLSMG